MIGINNRNLADFSVDVETTVELLTDVPAGKTVVSESGYDRASSSTSWSGSAVDAVLIGEALMRAGRPRGRRPRADHGRGGAPASTTSSRASES